MLTALRQQLEGILPFNTGAVYIFGAAPFRPGDEFYRVSAVDADGDTLHLRLDAVGGPETTLLAFAPEGGTVRRPADGVQALRIERAARVEWRLPWGVFSATNHGEHVEIRTANLAATAPSFFRSLTTALVIE